MKKFNPISLVIIAIVVLWAAACSAEPETITVRETVISELPVTVEVEVTRQITETVEIEVTRIVEVEITRIVQVTPTRTPTRAPTATPQVRLGSSSSPYPLGQSASLVKDGVLAFTFTVLEAIRGDIALQRIQAANQFNDPPPAGFEFMLMHVEVSYTGDDQGVLEMSKAAASIVTNGNVIEYFDTITYAPCCLEPEFDFQILPGGKADGWFALPVAVDDPEPMLLLGTATSGIFFALQ